MIKFLKKQLLRSWNFIKCFWIEMVFGLVGDLYDDGDITKFGKWALYFILGFLMSLMTILAIILMPFILAVMKYDESIGF